MPPLCFSGVFTALTGDAPFPWQTALYERCATADFPTAANIPTGLGKTSIAAIWLIALAQHPDRVPRRLVYVVNRRTVVDQTTAEVTKWRERLQSSPELRDLRDRLAGLRAILPAATDSDDASPLAISTLRGQFADNRAWSADPARPAVIVGTVDMIGSGLLFSRYTVGFKLRPHHAALLAQDVLVIHDEAHLEPAFQKLLESIAAAQTVSADPRKLRALALTATSRTASEAATPFTLTGADRDNEVVRKRINAVKRLSLVVLGNGEKLDAKLAALAKEKVAAANGDRALLVFVRSVEAATKIADALNKNEHKGKVATLTGTLRGKERDDLAASNAVFQRFLPEKDRAAGVAPATGTLFLVATSAGEVGVNLSADDLVCDLSTYESMAQRFGRVNRFGQRHDSTITIIHETAFDTDKPLEAARARTLALLQKLDSAASPAALENLPATERAAAFSPQPDMRTATAIQFDAWALTTIREPIAARPPVAPYLHGEADWQPPETHLGWRDDRDFKHVADREAFLENFPLRPRELLRDTAKRIAATLEKLLEEKTNLPDAWLVSEGGPISLFPLVNFDKDAAEAALADAILILPASVGGLENSLFTATADGPADDVSAIVRHEADSRDSIPENCKLIHSVEISEEDSDDQRFLLWCETTTANTPALAANRATNRALPETLSAHTCAVKGHARALAEKLLPAPAAGKPDLRRCLVAAAACHDLGKNRTPWQRNLGNLAYDPAKPETILAKSGHGMRPRNVAEHYRHEFGSLHDACHDAKFSTLSEEERDIVLHLIAAHHGRARPHFPVEEILDHHAEASPEKSAALATEIPRRFARLQHRFGRWGLAWLESLLRTADYAASAGIAPLNISAETQPTPANDATQPALTKRPISAPGPTITLRLSPANPGHYFACCGLFELAAALAPDDALAWFADDGSTFHIAASGLSLEELLGKITTAEITALDADDATASALLIGEPFNLRLDWWKTAARNTAPLKIWAGTMECPRIARAMRNAIGIAIREPNFIPGNVLFDFRTAYDTDNPDNKVEPFYFDANRGPNAHSRDVGFAANDLKLETFAAPAVELLTLVGLQRAIPAPVADKPRNFDYRLWAHPLPISLLPAAINGLLPDDSRNTLRFESWFRTGQRKHKAFLNARTVSSR